MTCPAPTRLVLPYPPSTNRYWRIFRGHAVRSAEATAYKAAVHHACLAARVRSLVGPVALEVRLYRPRKAGDLDNRLKVLLDSLQGHLYADDAQVVELHAYRQDDKAEPRVEVVLWAAGTAGERPEPTPDASRAMAPPSRPPESISEGRPRRARKAPADLRALASPNTYPAKETKR